jgi:hypothetical protein
MEKIHEPAAVAIVGERDRASLDALGLAQFIKTPARLTMRDERVFDRFEPQQYRLAVGEGRLLLPQILDLDVVVHATRVEDRPVECGWRDRVRRNGGRQ